MSSLHLLVQSIPSTNGNLNSILLGQETAQLTIVLVSYYRHSTGHIVTKVGAANEAERLILLPPSVWRTWLMFLIDPREHVVETSKEDVVPGDEEDSANHALDPSIISEINKFQLEVCCSYTFIFYSILNDCKSFPNVPLFRNRDTQESTSCRLKKEAYFVKRSP